MMVRKLALACFIVIFFITGCDKEKNQQILITNNYNAITAPIFIPNNKPTIKQKIIMNSLTDNKVTHMIIQSSTDGLIEKILADDESNNIRINYREKTIYYSDIDATIESDKNNNIKSVLGKNHERLASLSYNKLGQFIKLEDINPLTQDKRQQAFQYYNNKTVIYAVLTEKSLNLMRIFYNQKREIEESITSIYNITNDKSKTNNSLKPDNLKPNDIKCVYLNHNEYGDWTDAYCMKSNGVRISKINRELEY